MNRIGLLLSSMIFLLSLAGAQTALPEADIRTGVFPFFNYATRYDIWEYFSMDQGSRLIQLQLIGSERDVDIIKAVRKPGFFSPWGEPIQWDSLEKTEPEKSCWLNRWDFLPCFARQYYLTGDKSNLQYMLAFMRKWRDENPVPTNLPAYFASRKFNWRDMQVPWRMENLCWCYFLGEKGYTADEKRELYEMVKTHARVLLAYYSNEPLNENNHQPFGAAAMLYAALLFPDLPEAADLKARALEILNHHLDKSFYDDGNSVELTPGYYPFIASIYRDSYLLCLSNNVPPPPRSVERLKQFYNFMNTVKQPDDTMPPINDSTESSATVPLRVLSDILGLPYPGPSPGSHLFKASNQAVMRDADPRQPAYVFLDAGPQVSAHWHGGKLGFHLWFWDKPLMIDSGICDYDDPLRRSWYWNPEAHNTILVDGKGDFYKANHKIGATTDKQPVAGSRIDQWESNKKYDWAVMRDTSFENLKDPVEWTRHFILLKGVGALVVDQLESSGEHDYTWLFHLTPCSPKVDPGTKSVFTGFPEKNLFLQPAVPESLDGCNLDDGWINQRGFNIKDPVVHYDRRGQSVTQAFLLAPVAGDKLPDIQIKQTVTGNSVTVQISGEGGSALLTLTREGSAPTGTYSLKVEQSHDN
jgi:hypothetical protein